MPVYSVDTEKEAYDLLTLACEKNNRGQFLAKELIEEQTLENLFAFGDRLAKTHAALKNRRHRVERRRSRGVRA